MIITKDNRRAINTALRFAGLDGNGVFTKPGAGLSVVCELLNRLGIEPASTHSLIGDSGHTTVRLAWTNKQDVYSPIPIDNSTVFFSWYKRDSGNYECLSYVS